MRPGDQTELQPGMTFHFMTGLWMDDWGFEITESIVITETGAECLADVPRKLFVKDLTRWRLPPASPPTVPFDEDGAHHGFLRLPYSRDDSAWGSVMIPISRAPQRRRADRAADRRQPRRRIRRAGARCRR